MPPLRPSPEACSPLMSRRTPRDTLASPSWVLLTHPCPKGPGSGIVRDQSPLRAPSILGLPGLRGLFSQLLVPAVGPGSCRLSLATAQEPLTPGQGITKEQLQASDCQRGPWEQVPCPGGLPRPGCPEAPGPESVSPFLKIPGAALGAWLKPYAKSKPSRERKGRSQLRVLRSRHLSAPPGGRTVSTTRAPFLRPCVFSQYIQTCCRI